MDGDVSRTILSLAVPTVIGLLSAAVFHLFDALFVSKLGTDASAAVGITFAVQTLLQALGYTFGTGGGSLLSRNLGRGKDHDAEQIASLAFLFSITIGALITVVGLAFELPLLRLLGATEKSIPYAQRYWNVFLWSAPALCANFTMSQLLRSEGRAMYAMWGLLIGNLLNILLDPILIFNLDLGIVGAALATVSCQWISFFIFLIIYWKNKTKISIFSKIKHPDFKKSGSLLIAGAPSLLRQGLVFLSTLLFNRTAAGLGEYAISAMSVVSRMFMLTFSICAGIGQGMMSVVGYHYGAGNPEQVKKALRFALLVSTVGMAAISIPLLLLAPQIISLFRPEEEIISFGTPALRWHMSVLALHGMITCAGMYLQATGSSLSASLVAAARQGLFFLPLIVWIPWQFGIPAFRYVQPLADLFTFLLSIPLLWFSMRRLNINDRTPPR